MNKKLTRSSLAILLISILLFGLISGYFGARLGRIYERNVQCCGPPRAESLIFSLQELAGLIDFNSQIGQDRWIVLNVFPDVKDGYFVDVGSADGIRYSNTKVLEDRGWNGVCIDPFPTNMEARTCSVYKEVVYSELGRAVSFRAAGALGGIRNHLGRWKEHKIVQEAETVELTTTTLDEILAKAKAPEFIHYISLDIEGAELEALKAFDFAKYKVGVFTIEHNREEPKRTQIRELLEENGYRLARSFKQDDYYVLRESNIE